MNALTSLTVEARELDLSIPAVALTSLRCLGLSGVGPSWRHWAIRPDKILIRVFLSVSIPNQAILTQRANHGRPADLELARDPVQRPSS